MKELYDFLPNLFSNPNFAIFMTVLGVILTFIGIYITKKYRKIKRFNLRHWENNEILNSTILSDKNIKILHNNREIEGLSELKLTLKNTGSEVLTMEDFYKEPTIAFFSDIHILNISLDCSEDYIKPEAVINSDSSIKLKFEFIEPKDSISMKILYSARNVSGGIISGKIIGGNKISSEFRTDKEYEAHRERKAISKFIYMIIAMILFGFGHKLIAHLSNRFNFSKLTSILFDVLVFLVAVIISYVIGKFIEYTIAKKQLKKLLEQGQLNLISLPESLRDKLSKNKNKQKFI